MGVDLFGLPSFSYRTLVGEGLAPPGCFAQQNNIAKGDPVGAGVLDGPNPAAAAASPV